MKLKTVTLTDRRWPHRRLSLIFLADELDATLETVELADVETDCPGRLLAQLPGVPRPVPVYGLADLGQIIGASYCTTSALADLRALADREIEEAHGDLMESRAS